MNWRVMESQMQRFRFTPREREVARLYALGLRRKEIAEVMFLEESTVANHITSILGKTALNADPRQTLKIRFLRVLNGLPPVVVR